MSKLPLLLVLALAGCGSYPGPSVPMQSGKTIEQANAAIRACAPYAPQGGKNALVGNYVGSVLLAGIIIGPIVVASNEDPIRAQGEANAVDRCLAKEGFKRRDLTQEEVSALNARGI
ncbi:MAG: hypothetical protein V4720_18065, partial [Pseudomonadota bacterium]